MQDASPVIQNDPFWYPCIRLIKKKKLRRLEADYYI